MRNGLSTPAKLRQEGWTVQGPRIATSIQRFVVKRTGLIIDAVVLTGNRYLVLQDDTVACCKLMAFEPEELEYRCEYQRKDHMTSEAKLIASVGDYVSNWRQHQIDKLKL